MNIKTICRRWMAGVLLALLGMSAFAGTTQSLTFTAKSYPHSRDRQYKVYVPSGLAGPAPLVMALHGCQQTPDDVLSDWGLTAAADRHGFILVAPFVTSYTELRNQNCWGFWFDAHRHQGRGEVEDLLGIAKAVEAAHAVDPKRRFILGLSSGAAMAVDAAVAHNEYWAAVASASGLPYGEDAASVSFACPGSATFHPISRVAADMRAEINDPYAIALMVLYNLTDCTVIKQAGLNLRDAHLKAFGKANHDTPDTARARQSFCTPVSGNAFGCEHVFYTVDGSSASRSVVETVSYQGPLATPNAQDTDHGHYWIGGEDGRDGKWAVRTGPSYPEIIWDFFSRHPRDATATGGVQLTLNGSNPMRLGVGQAFVDPGAVATDARGNALTVTADCSSVNTRRPGTYECTYRATDSAGNTATVHRSVVVTGTPPMACGTAIASPSAHIAAGRAVRGGLLQLRAVSMQDGVDIGFAYDSWSSVTLYEGEPGRWYARKPATCPG